MKKVLKLSTHSDKTLAAYPYEFDNYLGFQF